MKRIFDPENVRIHSINDEVKVKMEKLVAANVKIMRHNSLDVFVCRKQIFECLKYKDKPLIRVAALAKHALFLFPRNFFFSILISPNFFRRIQKVMLC